MKRGREQYGGAACRPQDGDALSNFTETTHLGRPTRLADGLGLESTLVFY